ncbi:hypothetical protein CC79DRAFT_1333612 [Sarocladium strictum]
MKLTSTTLIAVSAQLAMALPRSDNMANPGDMFKRQGDLLCCDGTCVIEAVPGTEYDLMWHTQVSEVGSCQGFPDSCSKTFSTSYTVGWSANVGVNPPWASIGASASESWSAGEAITCSGEPYQFICVWAAVPYVGYDGIKSPLLADADACTDMEAGQPDGPHEVNSPSNSGIGGQYCVCEDACRTKGEGYWENWGLGEQGEWPGFDQGP